MQIGGDEHAVFPFLVGIAKTVDCTCQLGRLVNQGLLQPVGLDEIIGQLVKRSVKIIIYHRIAFIDTNEDFAVEQPVAIKRKSRPGADDNIRT